MATDTNTASAEINDPRLRQLFRIISALKAAEESIVNMSNKEAHDNKITERDRAAALQDIGQAYATLETCTRNRFDKGVAGLIRSLDAGTRTKVGQVLMGNDLRQLSKFGSRPWYQVEAMFKTAGIPCPLALARFHHAYYNENRPAGAARMNFQNSIIPESARVH